MRIAVIAPPWLAVPPRAYGGAEVVIDSLCRHLAAVGHEVMLFTTGDSTCPVERHWELDRAPGVGELLPSIELRHVVAAYRVVDTWEPDIVHDHTTIGPFRAEVHPRLRVVTTAHGKLDADTRSLFRSLTPRVPVLAISRHQASTAPDVQFAAVVHHGLDASEVPVGSGDGGYAVFLGRMSPDKGVHTAIRVARAAGVPLRIAAKMTHRLEQDYFVDRIRPHLGPDVEYLGEVSGAAKWALLGSAACLLNPLQWDEPFGMVMLEALACGTPVVALGRGSVPEVVEDGVTGYVRSDEVSLTSALGRLRSLDRGACRAAVEGHFSARRMAADHADLFERLCDPDPDPDLGVETRRRVIDIGGAPVAGPHVEPPLLAGSS